MWLFIRLFQNKDRKLYSYHLLNSHILLGKENPWFFVFIGEKKFPYRIAEDKDLPLSLVFWSCPKSGPQNQQFWKCTCFTSSSVICAMPRRNDQFIKITFQSSHFGLHWPCKFCHSISGASARCLSGIQNPTWTYILWAAIFTRGSKIKVCWRSPWRGDPTLVEKWKPLGKRRLPWGLGNNNCMDGQNIFHRKSWESTFT